MKQETLEEVVDRYFPFAEKIGGETYTAYKGFQAGAEWQKEQDKDFYIKYVKSEKNFQIPRIAKLGINTTGQMFEQMVTSLIHLGERSYSEEDMKTAFLDGWEMRDGDLPFPKAKNKWFEQFKKK
jgi:hypothetical protein